MQRKSQQQKNQRPRPRLKRSAKGGRPPFQPTALQRRDVEWMTGYCATQKEIAQALGIVEGTLVKHFSKELNAGRARVQREASNRVRKNMHSRNLVVSQRAAEFILRTQFKWTEQQKVELSGGLVLSPDERNTLRRRILDAIDEEERVEQEPPQQKLLPLLPPRRLTVSVQGEDPDDE